MTPTRVCIFCGPTTAKMTKEHLVPDWVSLLFHRAPKGNQYRVEHYSASQAGAQKTIYPAPSLNRRARVVCKDCNEGWLSTLENNYAKPLLTPLILGFHGRTFSHDQLAVVNSWTMKSAFVFEHGTSEAETARFYSQAERSAFMATLAPPESAYIWLAEFRGGPKSHRGFQMIHSLRYELDDPPGICKAQVVTITIGNFAFQVFAGRWPERFRPIAPRAWHRSTVAVWPFHSCAVRWPPSQYLTPETLELFAYRFSRGTPEGLGLPRLPSGY